MLPFLEETIEPFARAGSIIRPAQVSFANFSMILRDEGLPLSSSESKRICISPTFSKYFF